MKKLSKIAITVVVGGSIFTAGGLVQADSNFLNIITGEAKDKVGEQIYNKKEELVNNFQAEVKASLDGKLDPLAEEKGQEGAAELQAHFDKKVNELVEGTGDGSVEQQLEDKKDDTVERYKKDINELFGETEAN